MAAPTVQSAIIIEGQGKKIVFMDPSDPRIPSFDSYDYNNQSETDSTGCWNPGSYAGLKVSNAIIVTPADSANARKEGKRMLKPYKSDDNTNDFFRQFTVPERKRSYAGHYWGDNLPNVIAKLNKRDIIRAIYPFWAVEDAKDPEWYDKIKIPGVGSSMPYGFRPHPFEAEYNAHVESFGDQKLSDGKTLWKDVAAEYNKVIQTYVDTWTKAFAEKGNAYAAANAYIDKYIKEKRPQAVEVLDEKGAAGHVAIAAAAAAKAEETKPTNSSKASSCAVSGSKRARTGGKKNRRKTRRSRR